MAGRVSAWVAVGLVVLVPAAGRADNGLAARLDAVMDGKEYRHARWGALVVDLATGEELYARGPDRFATPASVTKLFSCAAALITYGPDHRFVTPVFARGEVDKAGVLHGDLILLATGDPSFGGRTTPSDKLAFRDHDHTYANSGLGDAELTDTRPTAALDALAAQVKAAGIVAVAGDVLVDDRLFDRATGTGSGPAAVSPIIVNDNVIDLVVTPGKRPGDPATVAARPETSLFQLDADVSTAPPLAPTGLLLDRVGTHIVVRGKVTAGGKPQVRIAPVDDPAGFARGLFVEALRRAGVRVDAAVARPVAPPPPPAAYGQLPQVAAYTSPPLSELIKVTLKVSHNLYASTLPCLVAVKAGKRTLEDGLKAQGRLLTRLGVDTDGVSFGGGAGGAPADCVTPRATVQVLRGMAKRPEWPAFKAALPSLGVDGTLVDVAPENSPATGKVWAKTGTLVWDDALNGRSMLRSKALAGVTTTKGGRDVAFALFVNDVPLPAGVPASREGKVLAKLAELIYLDGE